MRKRTKLVVVGDGFCGKTCLLIAFCKDEFPTDYIPTVFESYVMDIEVDGEETVKLALFDTAGQEEYDRLRPLSYTDADVVLICFSIESHVTLGNVALRWLPEVAHFCPGKPFLLVGTKSDLRSVDRHQGADSSDNNNDSDTVTDAQKSTSSKSPASVDGDRPVGAKEAMEFAAKIRAHAYVECSAKTRQGINDVFQSAARAVLEHEKRRTGGRKKCQIL